MVCKIVIILILSISKLYFKVHVVNYILDGLETGCVEVQVLTVVVYGIEQSEVGTDNRKVGNGKLKIQKAFLNFCPASLCSINRYMHL